MKPRQGTLEWITYSDTPAFSLEVPRSSMTKKDRLLLLGLTLVYAAVAFFYLGDRAAPQSFWVSGEGESEVTVDFGRELTPVSVFYYPGVGPGNYALEFSSDGETWSKPVTMEQKYTSLFKWTTLDKLGEPGKVRYMRLTAENDGMWLGELALDEKRRTGPSGARTLPFFRRAAPGRRFLTSRRWCPRV
jgi:hypothetical protein